MSLNYMLFCKHGTATDDKLMMCLVNSDVYIKHKLCINNTILSHKSTYQLQKGGCSYSPGSIYMAQLGTDGEGNKSQFSFPCVINTSNDPQLGSGTQQLWVTRFIFLVSISKVPAWCPNYTQCLIVLLQKCFAQTYK